MQVCKYESHINTKYRWCKYARCKYASHINTADDASMTNHAAHAIYKSQASVSHASPKCDANHTRNHPYDGFFLLV